MARRRKRRTKKIEPAVKTLTFTVPAAGGVGFGSTTIDLSQCASLVNRRFYRQGLNWAVAGFTVRAFEGVTAYLEIGKIPDTWVASNAWEKGMRHWNEMNDDAMDAAESIKPKFYDFKVFMDHIHHTDGVAANLLPEDFCNTGSNNLFLPGTWDMSKFSIPTSTTSVSPTTDFECIWVGPNFPGAGASGLDAVSLIDGYSSSRALPAVPGDPNVPADAADAGPSLTPENWLSALDNEGIDQDSDILDNLINENNQAPYPFENDGTYTDTQYPGGANNAPCLELHAPVQITAATTTSLARAPGTNFPGGLIRIQHSITAEQGVDAEVLFQVHLVPGPHRGYLCESMQDV